MEHTAASRRHVLAGMMVLIAGAVLPGGVGARTAPDWQLPGLDGPDIDLSQLRGQVVLLDFWASWCVPCRTSMPALKAIRQEFAGQDLRVISISVDEDARAALNFLRRYGEGVRAAHDPEGRVAQAYDLLGMPSSFIIDQQGMISLRHEGFRKGDEDVWRKEIRRLLAAGS